jgi:hypothetical protein
MGLFGKKKSSRAILVVEPDELKLEDQVETDVPGLTLTVPRDGLKVDLVIVGESFKQDIVKAVSLAANGEWFDIYLMPESGNPYDKNAVRVMVGAHHVGYVSKESAKQWRKAHAAALEKGNLLAGQGKCISQDGQNYGVFGHIWIPEVAPKKAKEISAREVPLGTLALVRAKLHELEMAEDPASVAKLRSLTKQAVKACEPLKQHCSWINENSPHDDVSDAWAEVDDCVSSLDSALIEATYADDPEDVDILNDITNVYAALEEALQVSASKESPVHEGE